MTDPSRDGGPLPELIADPETLARHCAAWRRQPAIAVDTEFVRERTFFPALGLIQIGDGERATLVDAARLEDLEPLAELFADPSVVKVFHACGEDLEVLYHRFGDFPRPLFDTQIAAALLGHGSGVGYARLVAAQFGVELPAGQTRSDWLRRPLSAAQLRYAALDVVYLLPMFERFAPELERRGRDAWLDEELDRLFQVERFLPELDEAYRKIKGAGRLTPRQRAVLRELAAWRESEARRRDLPRNFVVTEASLLALARLRPEDEKALARVEELDPRARKRHGRALLEAIERGRQAQPIAPDETPPADIAAHRRLVKRLQGVVRERARTLDIPAAMLASKRTLGAVARAWEDGRPPAELEAIRGWRAEAIGEALVAALPVDTDGKSGRKPRR